MAPIPAQIGPQIDASTLQSVPTSGLGGKSGSPKLAHAAMEFESVLLGQWLQSAEKSFATVPGSEDSDDAGGEQMLSFAMQQFAHAIASKGGLGIARIVQKGLEHAAASGGHAPSPPPDTGLGAFAAKPTSSP